VQVGHQKFFMQRFRRGGSMIRRWVEYLVHPPFYDPGNESPGYEHQDDQDQKHAAQDFHMA
jgi:hypothetical protein